MRKSSKNKKNDFFLNITFSKTNNFKYKTALDKTTLTYYIIMQQSINISSINLQNLHSKLIETIQEYGNTTLLVDKNISKNAFEDFNQRVIAPYNVNQILDVCNWLLIDKHETIKMIVKHLAVTQDEIQWAERHRKYYCSVLPLFLTSKITLVNKYQFIDEICKFDAIDWFKYIQFDMSKMDHSSYIDVNAMAASHGATKILEYTKRIYTGHAAWNELTCACAAQHGHFAVLKWLRANDCPWDVRTCSHAAMNGHLDILQWARENGCPWDEQTCSYAAMNNHIHILQWAHENGCSWSAHTCRFAAENNHLGVLQWLRQHNCPWDEQTCSGAAYNGHLQILQWARNNGCPWDSHTCTAAAAVADIYPDVYQWVVENGCEQDKAECTYALKHHQIPLAI